MTFTLTVAERERLVDAMPERQDLADWTSVPGDTDWVRVERTIGEILQARGAAAVGTGHRVTADNKDYQIHGQRQDTQANEIHGLTPKPLHEQVPGAWNFIEPIPSGSV